MSLETVQQRSTKYILQDYSSNYKQRLMSLKLLPLMYWYELQDTCMLFIIKCIKTPFDNFDIQKYIIFSASSTRSASHRHANWSKTSAVLLVTGTSILIILLSYGTHFHTLTHPYPCLWSRVYNKKREHVCPTPLWLSLGTLCWHNLSIKAPILDWSIMTNLLSIMISQQKRKLTNS